MNPTPTARLLDGVTSLNELGVIRVAGEDAAKFIHGQLTQDFALLGHDAARLSAFCSAKGRVQASFIGLKRPNGDILLVGSRDVLAATAKRLSMFVMRAKAKVSDASDEFLLYGLAGSAIKNIAAHADSAWSKADFDAVSVVQLYPAAGVARQLWVAPVGTELPHGGLLPAALWRWSEVQSGVATITLPLVDAFVPQMLNYESIGGVNFKKGCYPGQEVVARSQFRGTLKRRTFLMHGTEPLHVGDPVFSAQDAEQAAGTVVQVALAPTGGFDALVSGQITALESGTVRVGTPTGPMLSLMPLPYALLDDI